MPDPLVLATDLTKVHRARSGGSGFPAVNGIDFALHRGEAFGFLGPNGAGKSSTMRMIGCVSPPTSGTLRVLGLDPVWDGKRIRARIGVVPQDDSLDSELLDGSIGYALAYLIVVGGVAWLLAARRLRSILVR